MITKCIGFLKKDQSWPSEKKRNLANHLCKNDIREKPAPSEVPCKGCKICKMMTPKQIVVNEKSKQVVTVKPGATCNTENVVYALNCKKCKQIYVGHTGDSMKIRYSKHTPCRKAIFFAKKTSSPIPSEMCSLTLLVFILSKKKFCARLHFRK